MISVKNHAASSITDRYSINKSHSVFSQRFTRKGDSLFDEIRASSASRNQGPTRWTFSSE